MADPTVPRLEVTAFDVAALQVFHRNPRRGDVRAIAQSLATQGQYRPIVVNVGTHTGRANEILAGNHTYLAACSLGWSTVQATTVDVDDATAHRIVLADNRLADLGAYDEVDLAAAMTAAGDLEGTGYVASDLDELLAQLSTPVSLTDPDDVPALPDADAAISRAGDVWMLGPHRLLVGSSGDLEAVRAAMPDGVLWDCVWTDPPYGVDYVGGTGMTIQNDGPAAAIAVSVAFLEVAAQLARPGAPVYVAHADVLRVPLQTAMEQLGIRYRQTLMWVKDRFVLSRADYHYQSEPILAGEVDIERDHDPIAYGFTPGGDGRLGRGGPRWYGDNRSSTVFDIRRPSRSAEHPTMKPVELVERMLVNSCAPGAWVADGFGGSGSTLIAAHRLGRKAFLVELDPAYADVICRRFQEHTGIVPVRGGEPVDFTAAAA
ncbi:DNA methyltransferase [Microbacterium sp. Ag1]|uniref:DNA methyltransferase n=1 Tax=Microbacterium sp. Ag1 TaxID=1643443 RepID=UPI00062990BB|nr:DNA methyltransferase [Microbacterium sp. Ag1]KKX97731.1 DNA modification methylase [Microbacterium sp. Ag1]